VPENLSTKPKWLQNSFIISSGIFVATHFNLIYKVPFIPEQSAQIFDNYAGDLAGPYSVFFASRHLFPKFTKSPIKTAALVYGTAVLMECMQGRNFDPVDVACYTVGLGLALGSNYLATRGSERFSNRNLAI
jgi:hypothetical protein